MTDEVGQQIWERMDGEPNMWYGRFHLYLEMGTNRTMLGAVHLSEAKAEKSRKKQTPSRKVPGSWNKAAEQWNWKDRTTAYDMHLQQLNEAMVRRIMTEGLAAAHNRVLKLTDMIEHIENTLAGDGGDYLALLASPRLVEQWRLALEDIAKEVGGRSAPRRHEITGKDGGPLETKTSVVFYVPDVEPEEGTLPDLEGGPDLLEAPEEQEEI